MESSISKNPNIFQATSSGAKFGEQFLDAAELILLNG